MCDIMKQIKSHVSDNDFVMISQLLFIYFQFYLFIYFAFSIFQTAIPFELYVHFWWDIQQLVVFIVANAIYNMMDLTSGHILHDHTMHSYL